jgi:hypothetical protein
MKTWQERLGEALEESRRGSGRLSEEEREVVRGTVKIFVEEISRRGIDAQFENRQDRIGLRIGNDGGGDGIRNRLKMEMVIQFEPEAMLSVFSEGLVISNFGLEGARGISREGILHFLVSALAAATRADSRRVEERRI